MRAFPLTKIIDVLTSSTLKMIAKMPMSSEYTPEQVDRYLEFASMPERFCRRNNPKPDVEFLRALHMHQLCTIPFEDLDIHYGPAHEIVIDPQRIYDKFVSPNGRGGYCMEQNVFHCNILRALGFHAYCAGARVRPRKDGVPSGPYMGWVHCVVIVVFDDGSKWLTDVGYGGDGPITALPMIVGVETSNISTQSLRLLYEPIDGQKDLSQKHWIYQFRNSPDKPFTSCYSFIDSEFLDQDFEVMNFYTSKNSKSYMTNTVVVVRFLHQNFEIFGKRMLINEEIKENKGTATTTTGTCRTEAERVKSLKDLFGLTLTAEQQWAIYDTELALPQS